jgi:hypothetical protein
MLYYRTRNTQRRKEDMGNRILAIDPGPVESAFTVYEAGEILNFGKVPNEDLFFVLKSGYDHLAVEMVACYGMPVGREVFETCLWVGRYIQAALPKKAGLVYRKDVKLHICNSPRADDATIRQALIDRFGPPGTKKAPGKTYGIKADIWAAVGVAVTFAETRLKGGV